MLSCEKEVESGHGHEERAWVFFWHFDDELMIFLKVSFSLSAVTD